MLKIKLFKNCKDQDLASITLGDVLGAVFTIAAVYGVSVITLVALF